MNPCLDYIFLYKKKLILFCLCSLFFGCESNKSIDNKSEPKPLVETVSYGPVSYTMTLSPGILDYTNNALLTLKITYEPWVSVSLPDLSDRFNGFRIAGFYDEADGESGGKKSLVRKIMLIPLVSEEHRIAPIAVLWEDHSVIPAKTNWFPTKPIKVEIKEPEKGRDISLRLKPRWIAPSMIVFFKPVVLTLAIISTSMVLWILVKKRKKNSIANAISPEERALAALNDLLKNKLIHEGKIKEFYIQLTFIVRRYIEEKHGIRAPEQTTEEFLAAIRGNPSFPENVVLKLKDFLEAADLVKFAGFNPPPNSCERAIETAREYVEADSLANSSSKKILLERSSSV